MSAIAENMRRQRLPLLGLAVVLVAMLGAGIWVLVSQAASDRSGQPRYPVAAPAVEQAPWRFEYSAEGRFGKLSKAQRDRYAAQKEKVAALLTTIYDGIFLEPSRLERAIRDSFSSDAARSLDTKGLVFPNTATDVKATRRWARIGLDAQGADFAVGRVKVVAAASVADRPVKVEHRSTLWLERANGDWKVIAFDVEQGPAR